jgi:AMP nucleosidase
MNGNSLSENTEKVSPQKIASDSMERYSGSRIKDFGQYLLITNFPSYVDYFAKARGIKVIEGSTFKVAHCPKENISILDFKIGSPMAALVLDLCAYLPIKGILMLGMAGGLRDRFQVGDYFVPVGSIRGDGTSDFYFPPEVPALANFAVQRIVTEVLEAKGVKYHLGITHTTNRRFWEFDEEFKQHILLTRPQAIEMECATLFVASYKHKLPLGALLLISDIPLRPEGIKTKESADRVFKTYTQDHIETGVSILKALEQRQKYPSPADALNKPLIDRKTFKKVETEELFKKPQLKKVKEVKPKLKAVKEAEPKKLASKKASTSVNKTKKKSND